MRGSIPNFLFFELRTTVFKKIAIIVVIMIVTIGNSKSDKNSSNSYKKNKTYQ